MEARTSDYRQTSYISPLATTPTWLWKDKLHFPFSNYTNLITAGQVTFPLQLSHPPDYGRTSYISPPSTTPLIMEGQVTFPLQLPHSPYYGKTSYTPYTPSPTTDNVRSSYISPPATKPTWLQKDKLIYFREAFRKKKQWILWIWH